MYHQNIDTKLQKRIQSKEFDESVDQAVRSFMYDLQQLPNGLPLDTAGGDVTLDIVGTVCCMGIVCKPCILNPHSKHMPLSISLMERDGWYYQQGGGRAFLL